MGELEVQIGDFVSVAVDAVENGYGDTILSRDKAKRSGFLAEPGNLAGKSGEFVTGTVNGKVKGGSDGHGQRHPRLPARLADRHPPGQGLCPRSRARPWNSRSSSSIASATTWC